MTGTCLSCLEEATAESAGHPRCLRALFGAAHVPEIDVDLARFQTFALATIGHAAMSGVQRKLSLEPTADGRRLQAAIGRARYILKPQSHEWEALPENEHVTMNLARVSGLDVPAFGLVRLTDGSPAYLVRRFDRTRTGKLACEDFCQLSELPPKDRYHGTAERCARLVQRHATDPAIETLALFRTFLFGWWVGDGDMHLKNLSLLRTYDGTWRLSPAYDRVCTRLVLPQDDLAMPVGGKQSNLKKSTWLDFAATCGLPAKAAERALARQVHALEPSLALVRRSSLPQHLQSRMVALLSERTQALL